ncbi:MAG: hypothetical protein HC917_09865 [Richelia sp. SM2_1_7]|nr:hypothetical protein [Richelia sp. SM2_1_7]
MALEDLWWQKSDHELETAARQISKYTPKVQQAIRAEFKRRSLPEPPAFARTDHQTEAQSLGYLLEKVRLDHVATDGWWRWIFGIPFALFFAYFFIAYAIHSPNPNPRNLIIGFIILGNMIWGIFKAIKDRNSCILLHEKGIIYERRDRKLSAYYDELQIWQSIMQARIALIPIRTIHEFTLRFPSGDRITTHHEKIGQKLQQIIAQHQLPQVLERYYQGYGIQMEAIYLDRTRIIVREDTIPLSDLSRIKIFNGAIGFYKSESRFPAVSIPVSEDTRICWF